MTVETVRVLIAAGFFMMLLLLRLEAGRFGAAEYDEPGKRRGGLWTRLSWYGLGVALLAALYVVHPAPVNVLFLLVGRRDEVIVVGGAFGLAGLAQALAFARYRYGFVRLPPARAYLDAALNSIATAVIDEATFRGALLGTLIAIGVPDGAAILLSALTYLLATRLAAPGHSPYMLLVAAAIGLAGGWATLACDGIGAAIIGHAATSFAVFVCTGHAGQVPIAGREPEELEARRRPPEGWQDPRPALLPGLGAETRDFAEQIGPSGYADRAARRASAARRSGTDSWLHPRRGDSSHTAPRRSR